MWALSVCRFARSASAGSCGQYSANIEKSDVPSSAEAQNIKPPAKQPGFAK